MSEELLHAREIITGYKGKTIRIMEVCGTHTHEIFRLGIRSLLPPSIRLISGPGCPVCVTPADFIDEALWLITEKHATICTFGDLVRVPGTKSSLVAARSQGGKIQVVYTPLDAVSYAKDHPLEEVVFLSVGFETTTPASCLAVKKLYSPDSQQNHGRGISRHGRERRRIPLPGTCLRHHGNKIPRRACFPRNLRRSHRIHFL